MARAAGTLFVILNGNQLEVSLESVNAPAQEVIRETIMSTTGNAGYKETPQRQYLKFTAVFNPDFPLQTLRNISNGTLVANFANGTSYTLAGAYLEGETDIDAFEGKVAIEFSGTVGAWA
jgi:hypothetical protein